MTIEDAWKRLRLAQKEFDAANDAFDQARRASARRELDTAEDALRQAYAKEGITHRVVGRHDFVDGTYEFTEPLFEGSAVECVEWEKKNKGVPGPFRKGEVKRSYSAVFRVDAVITSSEKRR